MINAADIMKQLYDAAELVKKKQLDAESAMAIASVADKQIGVMRTIIEYGKLIENQTLRESAGDVFFGVSNPPKLGKDQ